MPLHVDCFFSSQLLTSSSTTFTAPLFSCSVVWRPGWLPPPRLVLAQGPNLLHKYRSHFQIIHQMHLSLKLIINHLKTPYQRYFFSYFMWMLLSNILLSRGRRRPTRLHCTVSSARSVKVRIDGLFVFLVLIFRMPEMVKRFRFIGSAEVCKLENWCLNQET